VIKHLGENGDNQEDEVIPPDLLPAQLIFREIYIFIPQWNIFLRILILLPLISPGLASITPEGTANSFD
jgi:hypothetical protein